MALNIVPNAGQTLVDTRDPIRNNFSNINNNFAVNHVEFNSGGDSGKHKFITFVAQNPVPVFVGTDEGMYSSNAVITPTINGSEIWLKKFYDSGLSNFDIPFTAAFISNTAAGTITNDMTQGWTYLPSGLVLKWGRQTAVGTTVTFPVGATIPAFANCFAVLMTPAAQVATTTTIAVTTVTATAFTLSAAGSGLQVRYFAIGW